MEGELAHCYRWLHWGILDVFGGYADSGVG